jgi:uncharacterized protein (DUF1800 family)
VRDDRGCTDAVQAVCDHPCSLHPPNPAVSTDALPKTLAMTALLPPSALHPARFRAAAGGSRIRAAASRALVALTAVAALVMPTWAKDDAPAQAAAPAVAAVRAEDAARVERLSWGVTPALLQEVRETGFDRWLQTQLKPPPAVLPPAVRERIAAMELSRVPLAQRVGALDALKAQIDKQGDEQEKKAAQGRYRKQLNEQGREAAARFALLALYSPNQLQERMTWFWMNHFSIGAGKRNIQSLIADYEDGMRSHALGRFRDVLAASVFHPAMLRYLDNERNAAGKINENYARELMELHTLGVDGGYTQQDVQELARVLTGLGVDDGDKPKPKRKRMAAEAADGAAWHQGMVVFQPRRHEAGARVLLGRPVKASGIDAIREVLDRLARHPATARYVSFKLAQYFVADAPPPDLVGAMADRFLATDGDLPAVLQTMFASKAFTASLGRKFKDPQHYVISAVRMAYPQAADSVVTNAEPMLNWMQRLGQPPYGRQTPDGWPMTEAAWSSAGQLNVRFEVARTLGDRTGSLFGRGGPAARMQQGEAMGGMSADNMAADGMMAARKEPPAAKEPADERVQMPRVNNPAWQAAFAPRLSNATSAVLDEARGGSADEWNTLALSSPEFMRR